MDRQSSPIPFQFTEDMKGYVTFGQTSYQDGFDQGKRDGNFLMFHLTLKTDDLDRFQVLVGLVLIDGWPIAHHVFEGNRRDAKTVPDVLRELEQRFGLRRIVFVGDRGMVTSQEPR
jgi:transposase